MMGDVTMKAKKEHRVDYQLRLMSAGEKEECLAYFSHEYEQAFFGWCREQNIIRDAKIVVEKRIALLWESYVEFYESLDSDELEESFYESTSYCSDESPLIDEAYEMVDDLAEAFGSEDVTEECRLRYLSIVLNEAPSGCLDDYEIGLEDLLLAIPGTDRAVIERCIPLLESHGETRVIQSLFLKVLGDSEGYRTYKEERLSSPSGLL